MMKYILLIITVLTFQLSSGQEKVELTIHPSVIEKRIDNKIYGVLLEHLYHSVSNGLWGETVWNRSFEELLAYGDWTITGEGLVKVNASNQKQAIFHLAKGSDYEIEMDVKRIDGDGPVFIGVRDQYRDLMLTNRIYCFLGTQNNTLHQLETGTGWIWHAPKVTVNIADNQQGTLIPGKWYSLRMRCKDDQIQVWLDNTELFNQHIEDCPKNGAIRIGAKNCTAEFRNIKVNSLDNENISLNLNLARHWYFKGNGSISVIDKDVLNDKHAVCIYSEGQTELEQTNKYKVSKNDSLQGSIYLKGDVNHISVQLKNGRDIIGECQLTGITNNWKEYPVKLQVQKDFPHATLCIQVQEKGNLFIDQVSLMHQSSIINGGYRQDIYNATKDLQPSIIRWPGGSFVELYDFEAGVGKQKDRKGILRWEDFDPLSFGTDEYIAYCRKVGAEPLIVIPIGYHNYEGYTPDLNGITDWLKKAQDWMEYCNGDISTEWGAKRAANGYPEPYNVKYWEIDNEVWKMNPELYAQLVRIFSQTLKRQNPTIKIIGCGSGRLGKEGIGLDSTLIRLAAGYIDYISPHHYMELKKYGNDGIKEYKDYLDKLDQWISESDNPDIKIYVSEWNLEQIDMRTGLFAGGILNLFEKTPGVEMAAPALFLRHISATGWNNAFINFDQNSWFPAPNYVVMKLWRENFSPNMISTTGETKDLNIISTKSEDGKTLHIKVVNPADKDYFLTLNVEKTFKATSAYIEMVAPGSLTAANSIKNKDVVKVTRKNIKNTANNVSVTIPKWSANIITLKQKIK